MTRSHTSAADESPVYDCSERGRLSSHSWHGTRSTGPCVSVPTGRLSKPVLEILIKFCHLSEAQAPSPPGERPPPLPRSSSASARAGEAPWGREGVRRRSGKGIVSLRRGLAAHGRVLCASQQHAAAVLRVPPGLRLLRGHHQGQREEALDGSHQIRLLR